LPLVVSDESRDQFDRDGALITVDYKANGSIRKAWVNERMGERSSTGPASSERCCPTYAVASSCEESVTTLNAAWIDFWAKRYDPNSDAEVLNEVGPRVRERGCYDRDDLLTVGRWKAARVLPRLDSNADEMIHDVTSTALAAPEPIQRLILTLLSGVQVPMASSLLMVWQPDVHTVIDVRAVKSLVAHGQIADPAPKSYPRYMDYLKVCKSIAERCGRSLRTVDRALYQANGQAVITN
jgi:hypothetical protein